MCTEVALTKLPGHEVKNKVYNIICSFCIFKVFIFCIFICSLLCITCRDFIGRHVTEFVSFSLRILTTVNNLLFIHIIRISQNILIP
jgi:hypothetical protein